MKTAFMPTLRVVQGQQATSPMPQPNQVYTLAESVNGTNAASVKSSPGGVSGVAGFNASANTIYLKLYDVSGTPNVGTDVPKISMFLPPNDNFPPFPSGASLVFSTGIGIAFTSQPEPTDSTPIGQGEIMGVNLLYY